MAVSYSWEISQLTKKPTLSDLDNVVVHCRWELIGTESTTGTIGKFAGATPLELDPENTGSFVAFEDLTKEIVVGWLEGIVVEAYWDHVTDSIQQQIDAIDDPLEELNSGDLPWSVEEEEVAEPAPAAAESGSEA
jgi:hypothetical protein